MNKLETTETGGFPLVLDDIRYNDDAYREAMNSILKAFGNNFIVHGCNILGDGSISDGYIMIAGRLIKVDHHMPTGDSYTISASFDMTRPKTFKNGTQIFVYLKERGTATVNGASLKIDGDRLSDLLVWASEKGADQGNIPVIGLELTPNKRVITDADNKLISDTSDLILRKNINIGPWNMNQYSGIGVDHGLNFNKIVSVSAYIKMDDFSKAYNILGMQSEAGTLVYGTISYDNESVYLAIPEGSNWVKDYGGFDDPNVNRGTILIDYIP